MLLTLVTYLDAHPELGTYVEPILPFVAVPFFILTLVVSYFAIREIHRRAIRFWQDVAASYGFSYSTTLAVGEEEGLMFGQGHSRYATHVLSGTLHGFPFRTFQYQFQKGQGKSTRTFAFTVYEFTSTGRFPQLYLNYRNDFNPAELSRFPSRVVLPPEFEQRFRLYVPESYEIEALQLFTPDTLALLLDEKWEDDLELRDGKLLAYCASTGQNVHRFMDQLEKVSRLIEHFGTKLNRATFEPVGDYSHTL